MIFTSPGPHRSAFPNQVPLLKYGDGDGIVSLRIIIEQSSHDYIVQDERLIKYVKKLLIID
ncbi:hypothetical protein EWB00_006080 [Schistosoma japonicum]|uniref:Uncharacterized protein n=1 Tax=Schistosoma japonicum TaxID=6182 RepID=A0A4Z2DU18_SCHJA|nr:hypothetical protein EWB00_006080 [Schistosoma japonicum]